MAKQLVSPIERHVEKAVLGVAGLALVGVIALYLVRTPNATELGGERVTPSTVDQKVAQKAVDALARLRTAQPKATVLPPLHEEFAGSLQPLPKVTLPMAVALGPEVPIVDAPSPVGGQRALVKVQRPAKPAMAQGRSTIVLSDAAGTIRYHPADWVTVSAMLDVRAQSEAQKREYGATRDEVLLGPPQVQRRMRRSDGSWSDDDWEDVACWPTVRMPKEPLITLLDEGGKLVVDKDNLKDIDKFYTELRAPKLQLDGIRPMPPDMAPPTHWTMPIITSYREVLKQDDEYLFPNEPPAAEPVDRYGVSGEAQRKQVQKELTPTEKVAKLLQEAQALIASARQNLSVDEATRAFNKAQEVIDDKDKAASPGDKDKAKRVRDEAEQAERDIKRGLVMGNPPGPGAPGPGAQPGAGTTTKPKRERGSVQQVWAHDAAVGSLKNGATYQYRMRFRLYNQLAGAPGKFNNPEDAALLFVAGEWSELSDPVTIEPATLFFVTSEDRKDEEISVEFYQWYMGVWVKPERRIKGTIGQTLRDVQRVKAPALDDETKVDQPEVEFLADATVVDIDFDRPFRDRKQGTTPKGARFAAPSPSTAAVFMDSQGRLFERLVPVDKNHPEKREAQSRLWIPPRPTKP